MSEFVRERVHVRALEQEHLGHQQPSDSLECNPLWFSPTDAIGTPLASTGALGWEARCGNGIPCTSAKTSLLILNHHTMRLGPPCSISLPLLQVPK